MVRVVFGDSSKINKLEFDNIDENTVKLIGKVEPNQSGFIVIRSNGTIIGDYSNYHNIKEISDDYIVLTKEE